LPRSHSIKQRPLIPKLSRCQIVCLSAAWMLKQSIIVSMSHQLLLLILCAVPARHIISLHTAISLAAISRISRHVTGSGLCTAVLPHLLPIFSLLMKDSGTTTRFRYTRLIPRKLHRVGVSDELCYGRCVHLLTCRFESEVAN
jgi:hypothetical protein